MDREKVIEEPKMFSGRESLRFLAEDMQMTPWSVRQEFEITRSFDYYKHRVPIGVGEDGEPVTINLNTVSHILILGGTGAGKSFMMRGLWNRFYNAGGNVAIVSDIKPEAFTSKKPVQKKFQKFLLKDEKPRGYPIKTYRPFFLTKLSHYQEMPDEVISQFTLDDISLSDFYTLLNMTDISSPQRIGIESSFQKVLDGEITNLGELKEDIANNNDIGGATKKSLGPLITNIERLGVLGDRFEGIDFITDMNNGNVPVMNLRGFDRADNYASAYVSIILRQLRNAKEGGKLPRNKHTLILLDEVNRFAPNTSETSAKKEILQTLDTLRSERGILCFSSQDYRRIPASILEQCKLIFISYDTKFTSLKELIKEKSMFDYDFPVNFHVNIAQQFGHMRVHRDKSRDWLCIDVNAKDNYIFKPLSPLSAHRLEGM